MCDRTLESEGIMSFNWCHGPNCHKSHTQDRVRGSKGNKVLRTRKVTLNNWNSDSIWRFFCSQQCMLNFIAKHIDRVLAIEPRREPLETPIKDPVKDSSRYYNQWTIEERT